MLMLCYSNDLKALQFVYLYEFFFSEFCGLGLSSFRAYLGSSVPSLLLVYPELQINFFM